MTREIYDCECGSRHPIIRLPVPGRPWERRPHAVDCHRGEPLDPSRIREVRDDAPAIRSFLNS